MNAGGDAIAVWEQGDDGYANHYDAATGSWGTAQLIESGSTPLAFASLALAMNDAGNGIGGWGVALFSTNLYVNCYNAATGWETETPIGTYTVNLGSGTNPFPVQIVMDNKIAIAVWMSGGQMGSTHLPTGIGIHEKIWFPPGCGGPQNVQATAGNGKVTISWDAVAGATSYNLYWNTTGGVTTADNQITGVTSPHIHTGLTNGTTYYYIVTAVTASGEGPPSAEVSATPVATGASFNLHVDPELGGGFGVVTSSPPGINCAGIARTPSDCDEVYNAGTTVTLTPTPDPGLFFSHWGGGEYDTDNGPAGCIVQMNRTERSTHGSNKLVMHEWRGSNPSRIAQRISCFPCTSHS
ncbi:MAG: fibronectin type III domain-containing protein [Nitrospiria bacterium]